MTSWRIQLIPEVNSVRSLANQPKTSAYAALCQGTSLLVPLTSIQEAALPLALRNN
jgi:hypothetical protein